MPSLTILLAEDEPLSALALETQLQALGHRVLGPTSTGEESIRLARGQSIDLAILDLRLPPHAGLDTAEQIFATRPVPIIVLTEYSDPDFAQRVAHAAVFHYLVKPVSLEDLVPAISVARRRFEEWQDLRRQIAELEAELGRRKLIERAKGLLMKKRRITEREADALLRAESETRGQSVAEIARTFLAADALLGGKVRS